MEFIVFTDESSITGLRYPSISAFSLPYSSYNFIYKRYQSVLQELRIEEFKWSKLKSAKYYHCAERIVKLLFENLDEHKLRIDVITWDTHDSRHDIKRRDDISNFERMFFHLLKTSMGRREIGSIFHIRPDERGDIDWATIKECLSNSGRKRRFERSLFSEVLTGPYYKINSFDEKDSKKEILIQIADLISGLASYSKLYHSEYREWKKQSVEQEQLSLFKTRYGRLTCKKQYCSKLLWHFYNECKSNKMGVSLDSNKCLCSYRPNKPINFWTYQPQGNYDKAPTKL